MQRAFGFILVGLGLACLGGGWVAVRLEERIVELGAQRTLDARPGELNRRLDSLGQEEARLSRQLANLRATESASTDKREMTASERMRAMTASTRLRTDPLFASAFRDLVRTLGLSDAQAARLRELNAQRWVAAQNAYSNLTSSGYPDDPHAARQAMDGAVAGVDAEIRALLGDSGYAQFESEIRIAPERAVTDALAKNLSSSSSPLNDTQAQQLAQIIAQNEPAASPQNPIGSLFNELSGSRNVIITPAAVAQAGTILSSDQLAALQNYQEVAAAEKLIGQRIAQAQRAALRQQANP